VVKDNERHREDGEDIETEGGKSLNRQSSEMCLCVLGDEKGEIQFGEDSLSVNLESTERQHRSPGRMQS
jgi:hypothetical protein